MSLWPTVELGDVMCVHIDAVPSATLTSVNLAGVYGFGRGLFQRGPISPQETSYKNFHRLNAGDFVISSPKAWEGALARIPEEMDGWFLSPVFPTFRPTDALDTRYLDWYCKREAVWRQLQGKAKGMGARRESVSPAQFLSLEIPLPPLTEQQAIVSRLDTLADKVRQVNEHLDAIERDADRLLAVRFRDAIADAPMRPMAEVAPLVRREIIINPDKDYTELGVRSFYKGTFQRRTIPGSDFSWQALYRVQASDLVFSNIMAWEQAIAIAQRCDDGCVGNHRMLTCQANAEVAVPCFLWYYFTTEEGFSKIYAASPGTAARNRTMTAPALMAIDVPMPPLSAQRTFNALQSKVAELKARHATIRQANDALIPATLERVFSGAD
ncbi:restriction endonuclease subunit S [Dokdonella immobilis]|uniref:Type I restriction enzyme, S subunit n=1 Tax=Dokdonella immobilis TaxID=578942 RepID=A0A1I4W0J7_9GAMM|nr:restriction endonuclease subunit S [Dokdonella immobilis]SFN06935.1 type I restriction enzyme, S subunit [Dokdonella immobilis]